MVVGEGLADQRGLKSTVELSDVQHPTAVDPPVHLAGPRVPPQGLIQLYSADQWEEFIREWATALVQNYIQIKRFGGSGDKGADVAAFKSEKGLEGPWDCFQGKHYSRPLNFGDAAPEMLKVFLAVLEGDYVAPDNYWFLAPRGCGTELNMTLSRPLRLKERFLAWLGSKKGRAAELDEETKSRVVELSNNTDFSMFKSVEILDALAVHSRTPYHAARFGTALKERQPGVAPPPQIEDRETLYVEKLLDVYRERYPDFDADLIRLDSHPKAGPHFRRQRISFYKAESLRMYARDAVPPGTFEKLQDDIYSGVIETAECDHPNGFARLASVLSQVGQLDLSHHTLITRADIDDRKGVCHQLANKDKLTWVDS